MEYYSQGTVTVDSDFARFGPKSYAINKINSVEVRTEAPHGMGLVVLFGCVAAISLLASINPISPGGISIAIGFGGLAYWAYTRTKKRIYKLFLMTSSSEAQALQSSIADEVFGLRNAIETAMSGR